MFAEMTLYAVIIGTVLDLIIGNPRWLWQPLTTICRSISVREKKLRQKYADTQENVKKISRKLWLRPVILTGAASALILVVCWKINNILYLIIASAMSYYAMGSGNLRINAAKVYKLIKSGDLKTAKETASVIVSRDVGALDEEGLTKAVIETLSDKILLCSIAPLFYMMLLGPALGLMYRASNMAAAMTGREVNAFSKKADAVLNFLPAKLLGWNLILSTFLMMLDSVDAVKIYKRDAKEAEDKNLGQSEAVFAGALSIQLFGDAVCFGELVERRVIGDSGKAVSAADIKNALKLFLAGIVISTIIFTCVRCFAAAGISMLCYCLVPNQ